MDVEFGSIVGGTRFYFNDRVWIKFSEMHGFSNCICINGEDQGMLNNLHPKTVIHPIPGEMVFVAGLPEGTCDKLPVIPFIPECEKRSDFECGSRLSVSPDSVDAEAAHRLGRMVGYHSEPCDICEADRIAQITDAGAL